MMDKSKQYETLLVMVLGCIAGYFLSHGHSDRWLIAALSMGVLSLVVPGFAGLLHWLWTRLSVLMGEISGKVLLTLVYILLLLPLAGLARLFGKVGFRQKKNAITYFTERNHSYEKEDMIHPW